MVRDGVPRAVQEGPPRHDLAVCSTLLVVYPASSLLLLLVPRARVTACRWLAFNSVFLSVTAGRHQRPSPSGPAGAKDEEEESSPRYDPREEKKKSYRLVMGLRAVLALPAHRVRSISY